METGKPPVRNAAPKPLIPSINFIGTKGGIIKTVTVKPGCCLKDRPSIVKNVK